MDESISHYQKKLQGELLTIVEDPDVGEPCMFGIGMYLSIFYCFCYVKYSSTDMLEDHMLEERYPDLNEDEVIRLD